MSFPLFMHLVLVFSILCLQVHAVCVSRLHVGKFREQRELFFGPMVVSVRSHPLLFHVERGRRIGVQRMLARPARVALVPARPDLVLDLALGLSAPSSPRGSLLPGSSSLVPGTSGTLRLIPLH